MTWGNSKRGARHREHKLFLATFRAACPRVAESVGPQRTPTSLPPASRCNAESGDLASATSLSFEPRRRGCCLSKLSTLVPFTCNGYQRTPRAPERLSSFGDATQRQEGRLSDEWNVISACRLVRLTGRLISLARRGGGSAPVTSRNPISTAAGTARHRRSFPRLVPGRFNARAKISRPPWQQNAERILASRQASHLFWFMILSHVIAAPNSTLRSADLKTPVTFGGRSRGSSAPH